MFHAKPVFRPKVNYALRPAKATVRHMVIEALAQLNSLEPVHSYRYIGMGSIFFKDFLLVHRRLGISDMVTIEGEDTAVQRVRFNCPLTCIRMLMQDTSHALPRINLKEKPHIVWLDYEDRVNSGVLADLEELVLKCAPSSAILISVNVAPCKTTNQRDMWLSELGEDRPEPRIPQSRRDYSLLTYRALRKRVNSTIAMRNAGMQSSRQVDFHQVFHLTYSDNARMLTFGGVLVARENSQRWNECGIDLLDFTRSDDDPFDVRIPLLTRREVSHLLSSIPDTGGLKVAALNAGIPVAHAREFAEIYRHAPLFVESEDW